MYLLPQACDLENQRRYFSHQPSSLRWISVYLFILMFPFPEDGISVVYPPLSLKSFAGPVLMLGSLSPES